MTDRRKSSMKAAITSVVAEAPAPVETITKPRESRAEQSARTTSRNYADPYRPFPLGAVNAVGRILGSAGIRRRITSDGVIKAAAKAAGLPSGFRGYSEDYREGLDILIDSIESEADLNTMGRMITRGRLIGVLKARFCAEQEWRKRPEILGARLSPPLIITGLQRTGTTLLHRLIASDPRFRSLSSWEVLDPSPPPVSDRRKDPRIKAAQRAEKGAAWMSPDFFAVHPIDHRAPEEDVLLLDTTFKSTVAEAILHVPRYAAWLESADSTPAYLFMRRLLLLFQSRDVRDAWILKTPHHLEFLDVLFDVFPEAKVVQTHRDPSKTMGSFLSMVAHGYGMFSDSPNPLTIGNHWSRKCRRMVDKGMEYRKSLMPEEESRTFLDIQFADLIADPLSVLARIYEFADVDFDDRTFRRAQLFLDTHGRHRYGRHVYDLADFNRSAEGIRSDFADYISEYAIPEEE